MGGGHVLPSVKYLGADCHAPVLHPDDKLESADDSPGRRRRMHFLSSTFNGLRSCDGHRFHAGAISDPQ
jgi:hypothetical protein